jgi:hypothetical protein
MFECSDSSSSFKIELSIILVWPIIYATCFELLGSFGLLPYEVGICPTLHWIPCSWLLRCKYQLSWQGSKIYLRRVWRYQKGNQNPYIEEEQTTQWPKEKVQKDKQRSTKHTYKTKDRGWTH